MKRDWRAMGWMKPGRKMGSTHAPYAPRKKTAKSKESQEKTELMVTLRVDEKMTLKEIGDVFGVTREAVRLRLRAAGVAAGVLEKTRVALLLTPKQFAAKVRAWIKESGSWYCSQGRHVVTEERKYPTCRECNRLRAREYWNRLNPNAQRRSPEQVAKMHRARWGY